MDGVVERLRTQCGQVLVLTALTFVLVIGMVALEVDGARDAGAGLSMQAVADSAALSAATVWQCEEICFHAPATTEYKEAQLTAELNALDVSAPPFPSAMAPTQYFCNAGGPSCKNTSAWTARLIVASTKSVSANTITGTVSVNVAQVNAQFFAAVIGFPSVSATASTSAVATVVHCAAGSCPPPGQPQYQSGGPITLAT